VTEKTGPRVHGLKGSRQKSSKPQGTRLACFAVRNWWIG
jgi:hypothetical protein